MVGGKIRFERLIGLFFSLSKPADGNHNLIVFPLTSVGNIAAGYY
jgi:hypothetical protein